MEIHCDRSGCPKADRLKGNIIMPDIDQYHPGAEYHTDERCYINELHNTTADEDCSIARARIRPGVTTRLHCLRESVERYVILEGEAEVEVGGGVPLKVRPMDVVNIPAGIAQRITNTGTGDLIFLCVCTPRFVPEDYLELPA